MEYKETAKEIIEINKANVNSSLNTFILLQEQAEKVTDLFKEQTPWIPKESWNLLNVCFSLNKQGSENFKESINASFDHLEKLIETT